MRIRPTLICWGIIAFTLTIINIRRVEAILLQRVPSQGTEIGIRFSKPADGNKLGPSPFSGVYDTYVNIPLGTSFSCNMSIPVIKCDGSHDPATVSVHKTTVGNAYIGLQYREVHSARHRSAQTIGLYFPTVADDAAISSFGASANLYDFQKYLPDTYTIFGNYLDQIAGELLRVTFEVGPNIGISVQQDPVGTDIRTQCHVHYGVGLEVLLRHMSLSSEITGLSFVSADNIEFKDRFDHAAAVGIEFAASQVTFGAFYSRLINGGVTRRFLVPGEVPHETIGLKLETSF